MPIEGNACRGDENKRRIVSEYQLLPIARFRIPPGQSIEGCCGELTDEQIVFDYESLRTPSDKGQFSVGEDCARKFLMLLGRRMPDLFDPFSAPAAGSSAGSPVPGTGASNFPMTQWDPLNKDLYQAILLWCSLNKQIPKFSTATILANIARNPTTGVSKKLVYEFIKVVASYGKTLSELVQNSAGTLSLRKFSFPALDSLASKNWINLP